MNRTVPSILIILSTSISANARAAIIAQDNASDPAYADGWTDGDNGGFGLQPWQYPFGMIDTAPLGINSLGAPAFALGIDFPEGYAFRGINPLTTGMRFEMDIDGSAFAGFDPYGLPGEAEVFFGDPLGTVSQGVFWGVISLRARADEFGGNWASQGIDTGLAVSDPVHLSLTMTTGSGFALELTPLAGSGNVFSQTGSVGGEIELIYLTFSNYESPPPVGLFFNNLCITSIPEPSSALLAGVAIVCYCKRRLTRM